MTEHREFFVALCAPFEPSEVKVRKGGGGRDLHYITARTAMNRLDEVCGPENWWDEYFPGEQSVMCKLSIRLPDGMVVTKMDAGGYAGMSDQGDDDKSGFSDAFKRACAKFGVARYLYRDGVPNFGQGQPEPPPEPSRAQSAPATRQQPQNEPRGSQSDNPLGNAPRSGKAMFAWTMEMEKKFDVCLLKYLNSWGKLQEFPSRMVDWDGQQVDLGYMEAVRKLQDHNPELRAAAEKELAASRTELVNSVKALLAQRGNESPDRQDYVHLMNEIAADADMNGEFIESVSSCKDILLLKRARAACDRIASTERTI